MVRRAHLSGVALELMRRRILFFALVVFLLIIVLGPLLLFLPHLAAARRIGLREYGTLAQRYVRGFDDKWLRGRAPAGEPLIGSADIQSLADLGNSYQIVREMRTVPFTKDTVLLTMAGGAPEEAVADPPLRKAMGRKSYGALGSCLRLSPECSHLRAVER